LIAGLFTFTEEEGEGGGGGNGVPPTTVGWTRNKLAPGGARKGRKRSIRMGQPEKKCGQLEVRGFVSFSSEIRRTQPLFWAERALLEVVTGVDHLTSLQGFIASAR